MAIKYRKKPVVVEAVQWTGKNLQELKNFVGDSLEYDVMGAAWEVGKGPVIVNVRIQTLEGIHYASVGDFIIKGIRGEFYPCKPDIFAKTYESATLTPPNEPLTWNEFEAMIDKPVYIIELERPKRSYWALVHQVSDAGVMLTSAIDLHDYGSRDLYGQSWLAYRRPPEGEEDT